MAAPRPAELREYVRHVYRQATALSVTPSAYLDSLADIALKAQREGKTINQTSSGRTSVAFTVFQSIAPADVLELIDTLRTPCAQANVTAALTALAAMPVGVRSYRRDFSMGRVA